MDCDALGLMKYYVYNKLNGKTVKDNIIAVYRWGVPQTLDKAGRPYNFEGYREFLGVDTERIYTDINPEKKKELTDLGILKEQNGLIYIKLPGLDEPDLWITANLQFNEDKYKSPDYEKNFWFGDAYMGDEESIVSDTDNLMKFKKDDYILSVDKLSTEFRDKGGKTGEKGKQDIHYHKDGSTVNMKLGKVFDLKRMMDWFQVIYLYLFSDEIEGYFFFVTYDILAASFARLLNIPCILEKPYEKQLIIFSGELENQTPIDIYRLKSNRIIATIRNLNISLLSLKANNELDDTINILKKIIGIDSEEGEKNLKMLIDELGKIDREEGYTIQNMETKNVKDLLKDNTTYNPPPNFEENIDNVGNKYYKKIIKKLRNELIKSYNFVKSSLHCLINNECQNDKIQKKRTRSSDISIDNITTVLETKEDEIKTIIEGGDDESTKISKLSEIFKDLTEKKEIYLKLTYLLSLGLLRDSSESSSGEYTLKKIKDFHNKITSSTNINNSYIDKLSKFVSLNAIKFNFDTKSDIEKVKELTNRLLKSRVNRDLDKHIESISKLLNSLSEESISNIGFEEYSEEEEEEGEGEGEPLKSEDQTKEEREVEGEEEEDEIEDDCYEEYPIECSTIEGHHKSQKKYCVKEEGQCKTTNQTNNLSYSNYRKIKKSKKPTIFKGSKRKEDDQQKLLNEIKKQLATLNSPDFPKTRSITKQIEELNSMKIKITGNSQQGNGFKNTKKKINIRKKTKKYRGGNGESIQGSLTQVVQQEESLKLNKDPTGIKKKLIDQYIKYFESLYDNLKSFQCAGVGCINKNEIIIAMFLSLISVGFEYQEIEELKLLDKMNNWFESILNFERRSTLVERISGQNIRDFQGQQIGTELDELEKENIEIALINIYQDFHLLMINTKKDIFNALIIFEEYYKNILEFSKSVDKYSGELKEYYDEILRKTQELGISGLDKDNLEDYKKNLIDRTNIYLQDRRMKEEKEKEIKSFDIDLAKGKAKEYTEQLEGEEGIKSFNISSVRGKINIKMKNTDTVKTMREKIEDILSFSPPIKLKIPDFDVSPIKYQNIEDNKQISEIKDRSVIYVEESSKGGNKFTYKKNKEKNKKHKITRKNIISKFRKNTNKKIKRNIKMHIKPKKYTTKNIL